MRSIRVARIATEARLSRARIGVLLGTLGALGVLCAQLEAVESQNLSPIASYPPERFVRLAAICFDSEVLTSCYVLLVFLPLVTFPSLVSTWSLDALNVYLTFAGMAQTFLSINFMHPGSLFYTWAMAARIFQCALCGNALLSAGLQAAFIMFEYHLFDSFGAGSQASTRLPVGGLMQAVIGFLAVSGRQAAENVYEARRLSHSEALVTKLLDGMHDVVVHLDADMCITRPNAQLASLMMSTHSGGKTLEGASFLDLCCDEDRDRVRESFRRDAGANEEISVSAMTVRLCDFSQIAFSVELNWACLPGELECFLVGIREMTESGPRVPAPAHYAMQPRPDFPDRIASSSGGDSSDKASSCSGLSGGEAHALVDVDTFQTVRCSPKFQLFFGGTEELQEGWKLREKCLEPDELQAWWQRSVASCWSASGASLGLPPQRFSAPFVAARPGKKKKGKHKKDMDWQLRFFELKVEVLEPEWQQGGAEQPTRAALVRLLASRRLRFHAHRDGSGERAPHHDDRGGASLEASSQQEGAHQAAPEGRAPPARVVEANV